MRWLQGNLYPVLLPIIEERCFQHLSSLERESLRKTRYHSSEWTIWLGHNWAVWHKQKNPGYKSIRKVIILLIFISIEIRNWSILVLLWNWWGCSEIVYEHGVVSCYEYCGQRTHDLFNSNYVFLLGKNTTKETVIIFSFLLPRCFFSQKWILPRCSRSRGLHGADECQTLLSLLPRVNQWFGSFSKDSGRRRSGFFGIGQRKMHSERH